jgi:phosphatidylglycerophosphatase A
LKGGLFFGHDVMTQPIETSSKISDTNPKRSPWFWIGVFGGSGLFPVAPGTVGTLASLFFWLPLMVWGVSWWQMSIVIIVLTLVGTIAADKTAVLLGKEDPKEVVIDEVVGQGIALLFCPLAWQWFVAAFILFRIFDVLKPWPVGWADKNLHGGIGIMADDVIAGFIALGLLQIAVQVIL